MAGSVPGFSSTLYSVELMKEYKINKIKISSRLYSVKLMKRFMVGLDFLYIYAEEIMKEYGGDRVPGFSSTYIFSLLVLTFRGVGNSWEQLLVKLSNAA
jgi:hypothetical protein